MKIDSVKIEGGALILYTKDMTARRFAYTFKPGEYEIKKTRKKRSLNANAYCWSLCQQIADVVGITKEEVYRNAIRNVGEFTPMQLRLDKVDDFKRIWSVNGVGWFAEIADTSTHLQQALVFAYHGSSIYDTKQMARLIDCLIQDANAVGIETISEQEKSLLLDGWQNES